MKSVYAMLCTAVLPFALHAQADSVTAIPGYGLSCAAYNNKYHPGLQYSYDSTGQVHNYSGNWDFDGDGKKDELYFIGNGGVHVYFHLAIRLSSERKRRDYAYLSIDMPLPGSRDDIKPVRTNPVLPQFVVADFDADGLDEIYLNINNNFASIPAKEKKRGLRSRFVLLNYRNKNIQVKNYKE